MGEKTNQAETDGWANQTRVKQKTMSKSKRMMQKDYENYARINKKKSHNNIEFNPIWKVFVSCAERM